eukprot:bmy_03339T0
MAVRCLPTVVQFTPAPLASQPRVSTEGLLGPKPDTFSQLGKREEWMPEDSLGGFCLVWPSAATDWMTTPVSKKSTLKADIPEGELGQWMIKERFTRDSHWKYDTLLEWQHGSQEIKLQQVMLAHEKTSSVVGDQKCDESGKHCTMSSSFVQSQGFQSSKKGFECMLSVEITDKITSVSLHTQPLGAPPLPHHKEWGAHTTEGWSTLQHEGRRASQLLSGKQCDRFLVCGSALYQVGQLLAPTNAAPQLQVTGEDSLSWWNQDFSIFHEYLVIEKV